MVLARRRAGPALALLAGLAACGEPARSVRVEVLARDVLAQGDGEVARANPSFPPAADWLALLLPPTSRETLRAWGSIGEGDE